MTEEAEVVWTLWDADEGGPTTLPNVFLDNDDNESSGPAEEHKV